MKQNQLHEEVEMSHHFMDEVVRTHKELHKNNEEF